MQPDNRSSSMCKINILTLASKKIMSMGQDLLAKNCRCSNLCSFEAVCFAIFHHFRVGKDGLTQQLGDSGSGVHADAAGQLVMPLPGEPEGVDRREGEQYYRTGDELDNLD